MRRLDLVPDCGKCAAVCCVATSFDASDDFAFDKSAGVPCRHLRSDCRCAIHDDLARRGFRGCAVYDCYGAGQRVTQAFAEGSGDLGDRDEAFRILRGVHELLWMLTEAAKLCPPSHPDLGRELAGAIDGLDAIARQPTPAIFEVDLRPQNDAVHAILRRVGDALGGKRGTNRALTVVQ